jgi:hypothetical protein
MYDVFSEKTHVNIIEKFTNKEIFFYDIKKKLKNSFK